MGLCNCSDIVYSFNILSTSLLTYLDALTVCECPEMEKECLDQNHAITSFHRLAYSRFCRPEEFATFCENISESGEESAVRHCNQVSQYERGIPYDEWLIGWSPFCPPYSIGASQHVYNETPTLFSVYNNMTPSCRVASVLTIAIFYLLAIAIITANITVLLVVRVDPYFHSPYGYFKASIAVADLLVGVVVIPSLIYEMQMETFTQLHFVGPGEVHGFSERHSVPFFISVGFFTILTLSVSVYCLAASSLDRYLSISRPFQYEAKKFLTKKRAIILIMVIWLLSTLYGVFPLMHPTASYGRVSATFILPAEIVQSKQKSAVAWMSLLNSATTANQSVFPNSSQSLELKVEHSSDASLSEATKTPLRTTLYNNTEVLHSDVPGTSIGIYLIMSMYLLSLIIPLAVVWAVNIRTIQAYRKKNSKPKKKMNEQSKETELKELATHNQLSSSVESDEAASRMQRILLRMVIAFTVCLLPAIVSLVVHLLLAPFTDPYNYKLYSSKTKLFQNIFANVSSIFLFGNSFVNCIIYTVLGKRFRKVTRKLYAGKVSQLQQAFRRIVLARHTNVNTGNSQNVLEQAI